MIKRVRKKFIIITMTMLTTVLMVPLVAINAVSNMVSYNQTETLLEQIATQEVEVREKEYAPEPQPKEEQPGQPDTPGGTFFGAVAATGTATATASSAASDTQTTTAAASQIPPPEATQGDTMLPTMPPSDSPAQEEDRLVPASPTSPSGVPQQTAPAQTAAPRQTTRVTTAAATRPAQTVAPQTQPILPETQAPRETAPPQTRPVQTAPPEWDWDDDDRPEPPDWDDDQWRPEPPEWEWDRRYAEDDAALEAQAQNQGVGSAVQLRQLMPVAQTALTTAVPVQTTAAAKAKTLTTTTTKSTTTAITRREPPEKPDSNFDPGNPGGRPGDAATLDHFLCVVDKSGNVTEYEGTEDYTDDTMQALANSVMAEKGEGGVFGSLQYFRQGFQNGTLLVFTDRSAQQLVMRNILWISIIMFVVMEGVVLVLTMILTRRAMRPMHITFQRQRQFISDAGHELKTPLTIISANVDILSDEIGENKWLSYIRSQTERMRVLISDMMDLSKLDLGDSRADFKEFSLSAAVSSAALPFESQAYEQHKKLELDIQEDIVYTGNIDQIKQLVGIFIDNAIKYSDEKGEIRVTLFQVKDKKTLKVYNTGKGIRKEEREKIFQRFYRSDASRNRSTGGYGLGLSIAMSIMQQHKIKVQVESEYEKWACFVLMF